MEVTVDPRMVKDVTVRLDTRVHDVNMVRVDGDDDYDNYDDNDGHSDDDAHAVDIVISLNNIYKYTITPFM